MLFIPHCLFFSSNEQGEVRMMIGAIDVTGWENEEKKDLQRFVDNDPTLTELK